MSESTTDITNTPATDETAAPAETLPAVTGPEADAAPAGASDASPQTLPSADDGSAAEAAEEAATGGEPADSADQADATGPAGAADRGGEGSPAEETERIEAGDRSDAQGHAAEAEGAGATAAEPTGAPEEDEAAREARRRAGYEAMLAGDYSAWDGYVPPPPAPVQAETPQPSAEDIEAVLKIGRDRGAPAAIGTRIIFHGDGQPAEAVIIGSSGRDLVARFPNGVEGLVEADVLIQYLDADGRIIWTSPDLREEEAPDPGRDGERAR